MLSQVSSQGMVAAEKRQWPQWVEWLLDERVTWADRLAERLKRRAVDAWEDHQLAAFWATNPKQRKQQRLRVEVGTVHDSHGSIPDHCAAALHLPKVCLPKPRWPMRSFPKTHHGMELPLLLLDVFFLHVASPCTALVQIITFDRQTKGDYISIACLVMLHDVWRRT